MFSSCTLGQLASKVFNIFFCLAGVDARYTIVRYIRCQYMSLWNLFSAEICQTYLCFAYSSDGLDHTRHSCSSLECVLGFMIRHFASKLCKSDLLHLFFRRFNGMLVSIKEQLVIRWWFWVRIGNERLERIGITSGSWTETRDFSKSRDNGPFFDFLIRKRENRTFFRQYRLRMKHIFECV